MPLRTLFSKKTSSSSSSSPYGQSSATKTKSSLHLNASIISESPTSSEYVTVASAAANVPSLPNGKRSLHPNHAYKTSPNKITSVYPSIANPPSSATSASSTRLRLFGRKKDRSGQSVKSSGDDAQDLSPPVLPPFSRLSISEVISDSELPNLPPPKLGQVFSGAASTRSLPNTNTGRPELKPLNTFSALLDNAELALHPTSITMGTTNAGERINGKDNHKKKTSLFSWTKSESKASGDKVKKADVKGKGKEVDPRNSNSSTTEESFNLRSFRHIQASPSPSVSPFTSPGASPKQPSLSASPYGNAQSTYFTSRSSHHLTANADSSNSLIPPPPLKHPTARPRTTSTDSQSQRISVAVFREAQARRSMAGSPVFDGRVSPGPSQGMRSRSQVNLAVNRASRTFTSEEESSEEEEEEDSDDEGATGLGRKRTVTNKSYMGARSEIGHGGRVESGRRSESGHGMRGKTKSEVGHGSGTPGASPSERTNPTVPLPSQVHQTRGASSSTRDSDDSDSDNTPLAALLPPRRPGSALSSRSNSSLNSGRAPPSSFTPHPNASQQERSRSMSVYSTSNLNPSSPSVPPSSTSNYATSVSSQDSSTNPRRPAPLIDINKLTGPNRSPVSSGPSARSPEKSKEGFTGGNTLISGGRARSPEKNRQTQARASSPTKSVTSTTAPANKKFVSPPSSPVGSVFSHAPGPRRGVPKRKETGMIEMSSASGSEGAKRDVITERLKGVLQGKMSENAADSGDSALSSALAPAEAKVHPNVLPGSRQHLRAPAVIDDSDSDEDEEDDDDDDDKLYGVPEGTVKGKQPLRVPQSQTVAATTTRTLTTPVEPPRSSSPAIQLRRASPSPSQPRTFSKSPVSRNETPPPATTPPSTPSSQLSQPPQPYKRPQPTTVHQHPQQRRESVSDALDIDLASFLGGGIRLISFDKEECDSIVFPPSPNDDDAPPIPSITPGDQVPISPNRIAPIVVRERERTPAFSVTSRPKHKGGSASVSGVISLGSSTMEIQEEKEVESVTTAAITGGAGVAGSTAATPTLGRPRSGSLPLLSIAPTITTKTTTTQVLQIPPPPRSSSLPSRSDVDSPSSLSSSPTSQKAPSPLQTQQDKDKDKDKDRAKGRGFAFGRQSSRSSSALGSNASAASGSSGASSVVESRGSSAAGLAVDERRGQDAEKNKPQVSQTSKHARRASGFSTVSEMTMRPQAQVQPSPSPSSSSSQLSRQQQQQQQQRPPPVKPFTAVPTPISRGSPATSSTGGSSSGRAPVTPRDGSELGIRGLEDMNRRNEHRPKKQKEWSGGASGLGLGHGKKRGVAFEEEDGEGTVSGKSSKGREVVDEESKRKERRRGEAKAAIELGNVINGRGPIVDDDEDDDMPIGQVSNNNRMNMMNPMMMPPNGGFPTPFGWSPVNPAAGAFPPNSGSQVQLVSPAQFMVPPPTDPAFLSAHQQAMMYAKQAYQMAVAQQAMAAAAEEWERGSTIGFSSSQSMYGGFGGGGTGSVYGGASNGWSTGSVVFPQGGQRVSTYGMSSSKSDYGGGGWGNNSVYGEPSYGRQERMRTQSTMNPGNRMSFMSNGQRDSMAFNMPPPPIPQQKTGSAAARGGAGGGRVRTISQPASPRTTRTGKAPPPSSWKPGM